jgi:ceramide glucosyltransferase
MATIFQVLLGIAFVGTISSMVYLDLALVAAVRHLRRAREKAGAPMASSSGIPATALPAVSLLKPLHGDEPRLEENLESFFLQDYPSFEIVFGCRTEDDASLAAVERLRARYPNVAVRVVISGAPKWPNAKSWSLARMIASSAAQYLVLRDSDVCVEPDFLRSVVPPLLDPATGLVTCLYAGVPARGLWSHLEALGMSVEMPSGVLIADMLEGMRFALGPVIAVRRDALEKIGGIESTAHYYSDDFVAGNRVWAAGYRVLLSSYYVRHVLCPESFRESFAAQLRWMQNTRYSRPKGHLGTGLTFAVPFGLLGLAAALVIGHPVAGLALLAATFGNRILQAAAIGYGVIGDRRALALAWLYPLRDLLGFFVWCASYCGGSSLRWRGELYRLTRGGRIVSISRNIHPAPEPTKAIPFSPSRS